MKYEEHLVWEHILTLPKIDLALAFSQESLKHIQFWPCLYYCYNKTKTKTDFGQLPYKTEKISTTSYKLLRLYLSPLLP